MMVIDQSSAADANGALQKLKRKEQVGPSLIVASVVHFFHP